jgi:hypothetical protein
VKSQQRTIQNPFLSFPVAKSSQEEGTRRGGYSVTTKARREKGLREVRKKPSEKKKESKAKQEIPQ